MIFIYIWYTYIWLIYINPVGVSSYCTNMSLKKQVLEMKKRKYIGNWKKNHLPLLLWLVLADAAQAPTNEKMKKPQYAVYSSAQQQLPLWTETKIKVKLLVVIIILIPTMHVSVFRLSLRFSWQNRCVHQQRVLLEKWDSFISDLGLNFTHCPHQWNEAQDYSPFCLPQSSGIWGCI